jgi:hypothetical protein
MIAKFPSKCCVCEEQFIPGESEIEQHPTMRGPKGGKKFMHVECAGGAHHHGHGDEEVLENPFMNAGRRTKKGKPNIYKGGKTKGLPRLPRLPNAATCDLSGMSKEELVRQGDADAKAELARRGRNAEGTKLAWLTKKNPFGYEF